MNWLCALIFGILLLPLNNAFAQEDVDLSIKLSRLLEVIYDNHIQPRKVDQAFLEDVQRSFLESTDPMELIYSSEEKAQVDELCYNLADGIRMNGGDFVDAAFRIWLNGVDRASKQYSKLINEEIALNAITDSTLFQGHVSESELGKKWHGYLRLEIISEAATSMLGEEVSKEERIKYLDSAQASVKQGLDDYFSILKDFRDEFDEYFLQAVAEAFDPHTTYFSNTGYNDFKEELSSERQLFGISYARNKKGQLEISNVLPGSSAWLSGEVHSGDLLIGIDFGNGNRFSLKGKSPYELGKLFEEKAEDEIILTLQTGSDDERKVALYKSKVYSDSDVIKTAVLKGEKPIGYISLPDFYTNWENAQGLGCANDLAKAIVKLKKESVEGVILDLRNNGGGSLKEAVDLAGIFLNYGPVLVTDEGEEKPFTIKDMNRGLIFSGPLVIMINEYSASASEVVAATLQDHNRALIVGSKSYGKATGQSFVPLTKSNEMMVFDETDIFGYAKVTNTGLYRINLETNQARGVLPNIELPVARQRTGEHEEDYPTVLYLDSISKKMYFTPLNELPEEDLRASSRNRVAADGSWNRIDSLQNAVESRNKLFDPYTANLDEWLIWQDEILELKEAQQELIERYSVSFTPESLKYDAELYQMDRVLQMYNDRFLKRLLSDIDLSETYNIINQLTEN